jgi:hypothetical protein
MNPKEKKKDREVPQPSMDDVLKRMLSTPPKKHKDERVNPNPAEKPARKRPAS